jgi:hypothetical protein
MHKEVDHNKSASDSVIDTVGGPSSDKFWDDRQARVIGRTQCRAARWMAQWAATEDDDWQQGSEEGNTPTLAEIMESDVVPQPLLDCDQGKISHTNNTCGTRPTAGLE